MRLSLSAKKTWLTASCLITALTGASYLGSVSPATDFTPKLIFDFVFWPIDGAQSFVGTPEKIMVCTIGATMILLAYLIYKIVGELYETHHTFVDRMIATGLVGWYAIETIVSLMLELPVNLVLNALFLVLFVVPALIPTAENKAV